MRSFRSLLCQKSSTMNRLRTAAKKKTCCLTTQCRTRSYNRPAHEDQRESSASSAQSPHFAMQSEHYMLILQNRPSVSRAVPTLVLAVLGYRRSFYPFRGARDLHKCTSAGAFSLFMGMCAEAQRRMHYQLRYSWLASSVSQANHPASGELFLQINIHNGFGSR